MALRWEGGGEDGGAVEDVHNAGAFVDRHGAQIGEAGADDLTEEAAVAAGNDDALVAGIGDDDAVGAGEYGQGRRRDERAIDAGERKLSLGFHDESTDAR